MSSLERGNEIEFLIVWMSLPLIFSVCRKRALAPFWSSLWACVNQQLHPNLVMVKVKMGCPFPLSPVIWSPGSPLYERSRRDPAMISRILVFFKYGEVEIRIDLSWLPSKDSLLLTVPKRETHHIMQGHRGRHPDQSGSRRNEGNVWTKAFTVVSVGRTGWDGEQANDRLVLIISAGSGILAAPNCLEPGPEMICGREDSLLDCGNLKKEAWSCGLRVFCISKCTQWQVLLSLGITYPQSTVVWKYWTKNSRNKP